MVLSLIGGFFVLEALGVSLAREQEKDAWKVVVDTGLVGFWMGAAFG